MLVSSVSELRPSYGRHSLCLPWSLQLSQMNLMDNLLALCPQASDQEAQPCICEDHCMKTTSLPLQALLDYAHGGHHRHQQACACTTCGGQSLYSVTEHNCNDCT